MVLAYYEAYTGLYAVASIDTNRRDLTPDWQHRTIVYTTTRTQSARFFIYSTYVRPEMTLPENANCL